MFDDTKTAQFISECLVPFREAYTKEEKLKFHFIHHNKKLYNAGVMKEERKVLFEKLLALCEKYKRLNQY